MSISSCYVDESFDETLFCEKASYGQIFLTILRNMQFLSRQCLAFGLVLGILKFGCWRYGEECTVFERQYGHNIHSGQKVNLNYFDRKR